MLPKIAGAYPEHRAGSILSLKINGVMFTFHQNENSANLQSFPKRR